MTWQERLMEGLLLGYALTCTLSVWGANLFVDAALILAGIILWRDRQRWVMDRRLCLLVAMMVGAAILAGVFAGNSAKSIRPVWFILYHTAPLFLAILFVRRREQTTRMILAISTSLAITSFYALIQAMQGVMRPSGLTGDWFILAGHLSVLMPFLFVVVNQDTTLTRPMRGLLATALCLAGGALVVNATRGVWLAVAASLLLYILLFTRNRQQLRKLLAIGCVAAVLVFGVLAVQHNNASSVQFMGRDAGTAVERFKIWQAALQMIQDHPVLGVGPGNFADQYWRKYILTEAVERKPQPHAHNNFLSILAEMGIVGLMAFLALFLYIIRHFWRRAKHEQDNSRMQAALMATLGFQLHGLSDYSFLGFPTVIQTYWFLIGLCWNPPVESPQTLNPGGDE